MLTKAKYSAGASSSKATSSCSEESLVTTKAASKGVKANIDDNDDSGEFHDALSIEAMSTEMDLDIALEEAKLAIHYFFNNKFDDARNLLKPWAHSSMYHSVGNSVFAFLEAILTFEQKHIAIAAQELKTCLEVCNRHKRKNTITESIGKKFKKTNYDQYTDLEAHAELCSAEAMLIKAMLTFIEDETLTSLIKGGMKIRNCFNSYKECMNILTQREWSSQSSQMHFESGVRMGMGTFNLMISLLPACVIKVLEFIGFSGNKKNGIDDLVTGYHLPGLRQVLCAMTLLGYHLIVCYVLSHQEGDLVFCDEILNKQLEQYPEGVWFLFFKGRLEFMKGNLDKAQYWYKKSWKSQNVWPQFHHLSFWELLWVNCLKLDWRESSLYATYLVEKSKWSRTIYSYQKAAVLLMIDDLTTTERMTVDNLMRDAPQYKQRIAGKSLPMEKFICKKAERYFAQNRTLIMPAIELMYVWNTFKVMGKHFHIADGIYQIIERNLKQHEEKSTSCPYDSDNLALILLLKGACLRQTKNPFLALKSLESVMELQPSIKEDTYLVPYALVEIGLIYAEEGRTDLAIGALEDAKKKYSGYSLESRLHFRIHAALTDLKGCDK
ncbi:tetratricopeptide repeat protein 39B-like isoform X2 [Eupeodes corollae]|nr:tetratricopeptide repeat protein 39B-like isoform X2 [Eupeodes corollae]